MAKPQGSIELRSGPWSWWTEPDAEEALVLWLEDPADPRKRMCARLLDTPKAVLDDAVVARLAALASERWWPDASGRIWRARAVAAGTRQPLDRLALVQLWITREPDESPHGFACFEDAVALGELTTAELEHCRATMSAGPDAERR